MSSLPLVSIVTPSYNQAAFLDQTIVSVLRQDYPAIEYSIVDGGSTDGSLEIIRRHSDRLAWWVSEPDSGQAEAINKGLLRANGEIVAWLNSDDLYLPGAVSQAVEAFLEDSSLGIVYGDAITIDADGKPLGRFSFDDWSLSDLIGFRIICQPAVFMRCSVLKKAGYLDRSLHFMLDHQLWIRMARLAPIRHVRAEINSEPAPIQGLWAAARHHAGAKNISQAAGFGRETLEVLKWMQTEPDLTGLIAQNHRHVLAGAYRLNARYLLDDGLIGQALVSYWRAFINWPSFALKHARRIAYGLFSLFKLQFLLDPWIARLTARQRVRLITELYQIQIAPSAILSPTPLPPYRLSEWPGLDLNA
jgi:glycosyltransferase involved in cell wall biosynthesis